MFGSRCFVCAVMVEVWMKSFPPEDGFQIEVRSRRTDGWWEIWHLKHAERDWYSGGCFTWRHVGWGWFDAHEKEWVAASSLSVGWYSADEWEYARKKSEEFQTKRAWRRAAAGLCDVD